MRYALARPAIFSFVGLLISFLVVSFDATPDASAHPPFPDVVATLTNASGQPANHLRVNMGNVGASLNPVSTNAPGCPAPTVVIDSLIPISRYVIVWPTECVDPGESITFHSDIDCTSCSAPTIGSYAYSSTFATFTNSTIGARSGLHVGLATPSQKAPPVVSPPGCPAPIVAPASPPFSEFDVTWPSQCVDVGESVRLDLYQFAYLPFGGAIGVGCTTCDQPAVDSFSWIPTPVGGTVQLAVSSLSEDRERSSPALALGVLALAVLAGSVVVSVVRRQS